MSPVRDVVNEGEVVTFSGTSVMGKIRQLTELERDSLDILDPRQRQCWGLVFKQE